MSSPKPFQMPIGSKREMEEVKFHPGFRTEEQFETVRRIVESDEFDFSCGLSKMFVPDPVDTKYVGPFNYLWYNKIGKLCFVRIGKRGKILKEITDVTGS